MRILAISTWFPYPPDNGARARVYHLLRRIGSLHSLDLIALSQSERDGRHLDKLHDFCHRVTVFPEPAFDPWKFGTWRGFFSSTPRYFREHYIPELERLGVHWAQEQQYDAFIAVTLGAAPYAAALDIPFKVLDEHNVECRVIKRRSMNERTCLHGLRYMPTWVKAERFERRLVREFDSVAVVSDNEFSLMESVLRRRHGKDIRVIPNGVDPDLLDYHPSAKDNRLIVFTGAPDYKPNYDAAARLCREVLPSVRAQLGSVKLKITGRTDGVDVTPLSSLEGVQFTGYLEDIRPVLGSASALVVPLRFGGGTRLKILEAMAIGTPVISTPMGAEGLQVRDGENILLGKTSANLAEQTCKVLSDPDYVAWIAGNARKLVRDRYQWPVIADEFARIFAERGSTSTCL